MTAEVRKQKQAVPPPAERPWLLIEEVCGQFGMTKSSAMNSIYIDKFPVPTAKVGRHVVVFKDVLAAYWEALQQEGLAKLRAKNQLKGDSSTTA